MWHAPIYIEGESPLSSLPFPDLPASLWGLWPCFIDELMEEKGWGETQTALALVLQLGRWLNWISSKLSYEVLMLLLKFKFLSLALHASCHEVKVPLCLVLTILPPKCPLF